VNPDESLEIGPRKFKRLGDCTGSELEAAIRLIAGRRIDRAWIDQQASGSDRDGLTIGRRFFASVTEPERDLIAYWQMVKLVDEHVDHPNRVVLRYIVIQIFWKQDALPTILTLDEALHLKPRSSGLRILTHKAFSHSSTQSRHGRVAYSITSSAQVRSTA